MSEEQFKEEEFAEDQFEDEVGTEEEYPGEEDDYSNEEDYTEDDNYSNEEQNSEGEYAGAALAGNAFRNDQCSEVTEESWGSRIGGAFKGMVAGIVMIGIAFILLFWNEGRAVKRYQVLKEGEGAVVSASADSVNPANNEKLVHLHGLATSDTPVEDKLFQLKVKALRLKRSVEMYQWVQEEKTKTKKKLGGSKSKVTTYNYKKVWSRSHIDSSRFRLQKNHHNPASMPVSDQTFNAKNVTLGTFTLADSMTSQISNFQAQPVSSLDYTIPATLNRKVTVLNDGFYFGANPASPQIGDIKVTFSSVLPETVSIIAQQMDQSLVPYMTNAGGTISLLQLGKQPAASMFKRAQESNSFMTWVLRGLGFVLMFAGFSMVFSPLAVIADVVPLIGDIIGAGTSIVAFLVSVPLSLITIAIAWFFYRPVLSCTIIAIALCTGAAIFFIKKQRKQQLT